MPEQFWRLMPVEFELLVEAYNKRQEQNRQMIMSHAWHTAALYRARKMPKFSDFMKIKPVVKDKPKNQENDINNLKEIAKRKGLSGPW